MRFPKSIIFFGAVAVLAGYTSAQQQPAQPSSPAAQKAPYQVSPLPTDFRITEGDLKLALAVSREVAGGHYEQVQKLLADNHVSIPQFQRTVEAACFLSGERQLAQAAAKPGRQPAGSMPVNIQNLQETQTQLKSAIDTLFGGRGANYKESKTVTDHQQATVNEICTSIVKKAPGVK
jgi:hypothetical protein